MAQIEAVVNSCRVCRSSNQENDFECLYAVQVIEEDGVMQAHTWQLTDTGKLYEDTLGVEIDAETMEVYPQFLCNSCDLQMRLFRKLTLRARRTLEELAIIYQSVKKESYIQDDEVNEFQFETANSIMLEEVFVEKSTSTPAENKQNNQKDTLMSSNEIAQTPNDFACREEEESFPMHAVTYAEATSCTEQLPTIEEEPNEVLNDLQVVALNGSDMGNALEEELDAHDTTSDTKEIEFISLINENKKGRDKSDLMKQEPIEFFDVHYLEDTNSGLPINVLERPRNAGSSNDRGIRRAYECQACSLEFLRRTDFLQHRKTVHSNKFPCPHCSKLLHTNDALRVHLRLHYGEPAYKCDLCQRTFNQKVHYRYHMDRHNNVRNFKCTHCEKAFLSKHDLTVHMRTHTGERPYECEICGKDFLILQHLKMHRFSHTTKSFECSECKQKFISPSTLHIHQRTIHSSERRFQCEFCVKRFRRKHHLIAHYKVHQKSESNTSSLDDLVEEGEEFDDVDAAYQQMVTDVVVQERLVAEESVDAGFLEIDGHDHIDGILVVDDEDGNAQAIYGADYVIGVAEESNGMPF